VSGFEKQGEVSSAKANEFIALASDTDFDFPVGAGFLGKLLDFLAGDVAGHNDYGVFEVNGSSLAVGESARNSERHEGMLVELRQSLPKSRGLRIGRNRHLSARRVEGAVPHARPVHQETATQVLQEFPRLQIHSVQDEEALERTR
jgi:hypothetical protein